MMIKKGIGHCLVAVLLVAFCPWTASAQERATAAGTSSNQTMGDQSLLGPLSVYSPFASGMILQQLYNRFLDAYIDPDKYVVGPGDRFDVLFTAGDISNLSCEINSDGSVFIKSIGRLSLQYITLREALEKIRVEVARIYAKSDFTVQLAGFRVSRINIIGKVARPGIYYAPAVWRVSEVIDLAGGSTADASLRHIALSGFGTERTIDLVRFNALGDQQSNPMICKGNLVVVPDRKEVAGFITISGLVQKPSLFEYASADRMADLIHYAGGTTGPMSDMEVIVSVDGVETTRLDGALATTPEYAPPPGANITLVWKAERKTFGTVQVSGAVVNPGQYTLTAARFTLKDLWQVCGGPTAEASLEMMQIYRTKFLVPSDLSFASLEQNVQGTEGQVSGEKMPLATNRLSLNPRSPQDISSIMLVDGDSLVVPKLTGTVMVTGAVAAPGLVPFRKGEDVAYYLQQTGGLGFDADRERMAILNPMTGGVISTQDSGILFDGEILFVPRKETAVKP